MFVLSKGAIDRNSFYEWLPLRLRIIKKVRLGGGGGCLCSGFGNFICSRIQQGKAVTCEAQNGKGGGCDPERAIICVVTIFLYFTEMFWTNSVVWTVGNCLLMLLSGCPGSSNLSTRPVLARRDRERAHAYCPLIEQWL